MQPSLKKLEAFFYGTEIPPYTPHLNHKSWILLPLVSIRILSLVLVRALSAPERKSMPYKAVQPWDWVASGPPPGDTLGPSFLPYSFVKPTSTDKGAIPCRLLRCGSVHNFQERHLKTLLYYWKHKAERSLPVSSLWTEPSQPAFLSCSCREREPRPSVCPTSAKHCTPLPRPAKGGWTTVATQFPSHTSLYLIAAVIPVLHRACRAPSKIPHLGKMESNFARVLRK